MAMLPEMDKILESLPELDKILESVSLATVDAKDKILESLKSSADSIPKLDDIVEKINSIKMDDVVQKINDVYDNLDVKKVVIITGTAGTIYYFVNRVRKQPSNCVRSNYRDDIQGIPTFLSRIILGTDGLLFGFNDMIEVTKHDWKTYDHQVVQFRQMSPGKTQWQNFPLTPPFLATICPKNVEYILNSNFSNYQKGSFMRSILRDLLGDGIFNADGENWRQQRKIASFAFTQNAFKDFMFGVMQRHIETLGDLLQKNKGEEIDTFAILNRFTLDSIGEIGFGQNIDSLSSYPNYHPFLTAFDRSQANSMLRFQNPIWGIHKLLNIKAEYYMAQDCQALREKGAEVVAAMREKFEADGQGGDFLSLFLARAEQEGQEVDDGFLVDICLNFLIAGRDTTATVLSWMLWEVCQRPEVLEKARAEISEVLDGEHMTFDDVSCFEYLRAIQNESLRLHPSVPRDVRFCVNDDILPDGTKIKAGSGIAYCAYAMARDPDLWGEDCLEFKPERWLDMLANNFDMAQSPPNTGRSSSDGSPVRRTTSGRIVRSSIHGLPNKREGDDLDFQYVFPAFHAGPRQCLGKRMAYMEMTVAMVHIFRDFDFELVGKPEDTTYTQSLTLAIKGGLKMKFTPRKSGRRSLDKAQTLDMESIIHSAASRLGMERG